MKKLMLISVVLLSVSVVNAQFSIGPTAGFGHTWFENDDVNEPASLEYEFMPHMNAGVELLYSFPGAFAISAAFKYSGEGAKYTYESSGNTIQTKTRASYFRIPLQLVYHFGDAMNSVRPRLSVGPSFGFLTGGKLETSDDGTLILEMKSKDFLESFDFGIDAGAGVAFRVGSRTWLSAVVNYHHGMSNMYKETDFDVEGRNIGLNLGLNIPVGK